MMKMTITIKIKLETTDNKILKSKQYFLTQFCKIFNIKYKHTQLPKKIKKIALLRSPHIHKKTWRTYLIKTFKFDFILYFETKTSFTKNIFKFNNLINILSANCRIKVNFLC